MNLIAQPRIVSPKSGQDWLVTGFKMVWAQPMAWLRALTLYWFLLAVLGLLPLGLGILLPLVLAPALSLGFLALAHALQTQPDVRPAPFLLFTGLGPAHRSGLIRLGLWHLMLLLGMVLLVSLIRLALGEEIQGLEQVEAMDPAQADPAAILAALGVDFGQVLLLMLGYLPIFMAFWFAPQLVVWQGFGPGKALFFSFFAVWRNRLAFLLMGIAWLSMVFLSSSVAGLAMSLFGAGPQLAMLLLVPLSLLVMAVTQAAAYASTQAILGAADTPA